MTVHIPCYIINEEILQFTKNTIDSFSGSGVSISTFDNASPLGGGYLRSVSGLYMRSDKNLGYGKAMNYGLHYIHDEYIVLANNDIRVSPNWLQVSMEVFQEPNVYSCHFRMTDYDVPFEYGKSIVYSGKERWCTSSFFVIKTRDEKGNRRVFEFDPKYGIGGYEDYDYWHQVRQAGLKQAYTDRACYQHHHSTTQNALNQDERRERDARSREYFKSKWGGYPDEMFAQEFPDQMKVPYWEGFQI